MSTSTRRLLAVVALVGVLGAGGCTKDEAPDFPTTGTLTADDLGPGDWTGPYETWTDTEGAAGSGSLCKRTPNLWSVTPPAQAKGTAVWQDGEVLVWSLAFRYYSPAGADEKMDQMRQLEACVEDATSDTFNDWTFTYHDDGTVITTHEVNALGGGAEIEIAMTSKGDTVVEVLVSYPVGKKPDVSAEGLLDQAVKAAAALPDGS